MILLRIGLLSSDFYSDNEIKIQATEGCPDQGIQVETKHQNIILDFFISELNFEYKLPIL